MATKPTLADEVEADVQSAVDALRDASNITTIRGKVRREHRLEFVIQEAMHEADQLENEGHGGLASQLRTVAEALRVIYPKVVATKKGL